MKRTEEQVKQLQMIDEEINYLYSKLIGKLIDKEPCIITVPDEETLEGYKMLLKLMGLTFQSNIVMWMALDEEIGDALDKETFNHFKHLLRANITSKTIIKRVFEQLHANSRKK